MKGEWDQLKTKFHVPDINIFEPQYLEPESAYYGAIHQVDSIV